MAPAVAERAFELKDGEVSEAIRTPQGFAFVTVTGKQDAYVPKLDEVKAKVRDEVVKKKATDVARQKAATIGAQMKPRRLQRRRQSRGARREDDRVHRPRRRDRRYRRQPGVDAVAVHACSPEP